MDTAFDDASLGGAEAAGMVHDHHGCWALRTSVLNYIDSFSNLIAAQGRLVSIGDIQEAVVIFPCVVNVRHQSVAFQEVFAIDKKVQRPCLRKLNSLSNDVVKVIGREIVRHQILGLVDIWQL